LHCNKYVTVINLASEISNIFIFFVLSKALLKLAPEIRVLYSPVSSFERSQGFLFPLPTMLLICLSQHILLVMVTLSYLLASSVFCKYWIILAVNTTESLPCFPKSAKFLRNHRLVMVTLSYLLASSVSLAISEMLIE
jgi:hypothetical protein